MFYNCKHVCCWLTYRFNGVQQQFKQRITKAEKELRNEHEALTMQRLSVPQQHGITH